MRAVDADLVELRLDLVDRPDVAGALHGRRTPVIVTCRAQWEGGGFTGSEEERRRILESARGARRRVRRRRGGREPSRRTSMRARGRAAGIVLSSHIFGDPPADLAARYAAMRATGRRSGQARDSGRPRSNETLPLFDLGREHADEPGRGHVLIAWAIRACRRACWRRGCGNRWTYAGDGVAPGQMPAARLLRRVPVPADRAGRRALRASSATRSSIRCRRSCTTPASRRWG